MKGNITRRGKTSWRLKFDAGRDSVTGKRKTQYHTFRGSKREAENKLAELIASVSNNSYVEPSRTTIAQFVPGRIDQWQAAGDISARTASRYRELCANQIMAHIGSATLHKLKALEIEKWHNALRTSGRADGRGGLAPRTIGHAHRVLGKALKDAVKHGLLAANPCELETAPKVEDDEEMIIVQDVPSLVQKLAGTRLYVPAMVALFTGARVGEVLALRWGRVDLDRKLIQIREALEHTKQHGVRFKPPKTKAGRRDVTLPDILVDVLSEHRKAQLEVRMQLGAGRLPDDALLFGDLNGRPLSPNSVSSAWSHLAETIGMPEVTFHALRHTHASQLIDSGVDIVTISKRLGHSKPDITLRVYAHLFRKDDGKAAAAINAALGIV